MDYRRIWAPGATYFFTVNLKQRRNNQLLVERIDELKQAIHATRQRFPFSFDAWVVLPEHMHVVWTLPQGDADNATRWRLIKAGFSKRIEHGEY
jgi:putative transposase